MFTSRDAGGFEGAQQSRDRGRGDWGLSLTLAAS